MNTNKKRTPNNLNEALESLPIMLCQEDLNWIDNAQEDDMIQLHSNLGRWLRNNWGLWHGSNLSKYFNSLGITHADDMSGIILTSFWRYRHNKPLELDEQVQEYKNYWEKMNVGEVIKITLPIEKNKRF